jgi:hypothetical protein
VDQQQGAPSVQGKSIWRGNGVTQSRRTLTPMTSTPKQRWFRFSLRTLFVAAAVSVILGPVLGVLLFLNIWLPAERQMIDHRRQMLYRLIKVGADIQGPEIFVQGKATALSPQPEWKRLHGPRLPGPIPPVRLLLGDVFIGGIWLVDRSEEITEVLDAFPEATVFIPVRE